MHLMGRVSSGFLLLGLALLHSQSRAAPLMPAICRRYLHGASKLPKFWHAGRCCGAGWQLQNIWAACGDNFALGPKQAQCCKPAKRFGALQGCWHCNTASVSW